MTPMQALSVQPARRSDLSAILSLLGELGRPSSASSGGATREAALAILGRDDTAVLLARRGDEVVGLACVLVLPRLGHGRPEARLLDLVVTEGARSEGIGRVLVDAAVQFARERDCRILRLECGKWRVDAQRFYRRLGFESKGEDMQLSLDDAAAGAAADLST